MNQSNVQPKESNSGGNQSCNPKIWTIHDPFKYSPPKPDGDPWSLLLEPLLKEDKVRCDSWKDEVENLLIFAGLFSAVVTAFIIESYKNLQRDPNDAILNVLSHIARRLDNASDDSTNSSAFSSPLIPKFSPTSPAIRINTLWFISLVLSLTTVLVGIICLQWLREHQSYPSSSTRQNYAIFNMRAEALERWHVRGIFTTLPLLLQCALIFFLVGLTDFLHSFGNLAVLIPVGIVVSLTLLFLAATTFLPAFQGLSLYIRSSDPRTHLNPPVQCPYKSPQSNAVRAIIIPLFRLFHYSHPHFRSFFHKLHQCLNKFRGAPDMPPLSDDDFTSYVRVTYAWAHQIWSNFDVAWLEIRDVYMRRAFGRSLDGRLLGQDNNLILPIYDLLEGLTYQISDDDVLVAPAYHAFGQISDLTLMPLHPRSSYSASTSRFTQNAYLHDLIAHGQPHPDKCLTDFLAIEKSDSLIFSHYYQGGPTSLIEVLKQENIASFLYNPSITSSSSILLLHRTEAQLRLLRHLHEKPYEMRKVATESLLPRCFDISSFENYLFELDFTQEGYEAVSWQFSQLALALLQDMKGELQPNTLVHTIYSHHGGMSMYVEALRQFTFHALWIPAVRDDVKESFHSILDFINDTLSQEIETQGADALYPSLMFYIAALYIQDFFPPRLNSSVDSLVSTICKYKKLTTEIGRINASIEDQLRPVESSSMEFENMLSGPVFSEWWWKTIETHNIISHWESDSLRNPTPLGVQPALQRNEVDITTEPPVDQQIDSSCRRPANHAWNSRCIYWTNLRLCSNPSNPSSRLKARVFCDIKLNAQKMSIILVV